MRCNVMADTMTKTKAPLIGKLRAKQAFKDFTGHEPTQEYITQLDSRPVAGYRMGSTVGIAYEATRDGKTERYFHEFKKKARPDLVARSDGRQLFLTRGNYKVTDRGIEDMGVPLFVVNPSKRPSLRKGKPAMARRLRRKRRSTAVTVFARNPIKRRRRRSVLRTFARNPIRRHRRRRTIGAHSYRRNPSRRRGFRRNPIGGGLSFRKMIFPAMAIGVGAVGSELVMGYLPIPAMLKTGAVRHVTKGVVSLGIGWVLANVLKQRKMGEAFALGGLVIATHDAAKELIVKFMPSAQFGQYMPAGLGGAFLPRVGGSPGARPGTMGYYSPGATVGMGQYVPGFGASPANLPADGYDSDFRP